MGFNYLQTDDRDDYFDQFKRKPNPPSFFYNLHTIKDSSGNILIIARSGECVRYTMKKFKKGRRTVSHNWKQLLKQIGLIITTEQVPL